MIEAYLQIKANHFEVYYLREYSCYLAENQVPV